MNKLEAFGNIDQEQVLVYLALFELSEPLLGFLEQLDRRLPAGDNIKNTLRYQLHKKVD